MESSHSEPPEPKPPDKVPTPSSSPPRKSRPRERTVKNQYDTNKSEQTKCAQLVSTAECRKPTENPEVVVKRILSVRVKDTDSDSVSLTDKYTSSEDLSGTITDATNIDVTDVTYDPACLQRET
ncbi:hypothetical protein JTB14_004249 [Gonioctena quinquepunctata]|nr:hypothetical protein JTB14_004249 [Gonioctena quinquepunctata]